MAYSVSYQLMWDTIRCLSLNGDDISDEEIAEHLEEIEGDNYTFLQIINLKEYKKLGLVTDELIGLIVVLRQSVEDLPKHLWNTQSFKNDEKWLAIRKSAMEIFNKLKIPSNL